MIRYLKDENEIVKLFPLFIQEGKANGEDTEKLNPDKLWNNIKACMDNAAIIVDEQDGVITGCMVLALIDFYWKDNHMLTNLMYFVAPEYRDSKIGSQLLAEALNYVNSTGLEFTLHVESYQDLERKDKFFKRKGLINCGGSYTYKGVRHA